MADDIGWMKERLGLFAHSLLLGRIHDPDLDVDSILKYATPLHCAVQQHDTLQKAISHLMLSASHDHGARHESLLYLCLSSSLSHDCTCVQLVTVICITCWPSRLVLVAVTVCCVSHH